MKSLFLGLIASIAVFVAAASSYATHNVNVSVVRNVGYGHVGFASYGYHNVGYAAYAVAAPICATVSYTVAQPVYATPVVSAPVVCAPVTYAAPAVTVEAPVYTAPVCAQVAVSYATPVYTAPVYSSAVFASHYNTFRSSVFVNRSFVHPVVNTSVAVARVGVDVVRASARSVAVSVNAVRTGFGRRIDNLRTRRLAVISAKLATPRRGR